MPSKEKKQPEVRDDSFKSEMMHRLKTHPFLFIGTVLVLVIVVVAFVFVPAMVPNAQIGGELIFGYYNKTPIKYVQNNHFSNALANLSQSQPMTSDDPNYIFNMYRMWMGAFQETVMHTGILDEMKTAGYEAPEGVVDREVAELPMFQEYDSAGNPRFSAAKYRELDNNSRITLWRQVKDNVAVQYYISDMAGMRTSSGEAAFVSSIASPRRTFDSAVFPFSSYPDSELAGYARENSGLFRVTRLSRITIESSEKEARQILDSIKNGVSTFEDAARANSRDMYAEKGGDMGIRMAYELIPEIADEQVREGVINLAQGSLSDLVKVSTGWAFFRAEDTARPADTNDTIQLGNIRNYIMNTDKGRIEDWLLAEAEKFSAQARANAGNLTVPPAATVENENASVGARQVNGFIQAATSGNITRKSFGPIPVNYGNTAILGSISTTSNPELAGAETMQNFWQAAFFTPLNTPSKPLVIGNNVIVLFPLEENALDESEAESIETYYPWWQSSSMEAVYQNYFLNSEKLENRFDETFWKLWAIN